MQISSATVEFEEYGYDDGDCQDTLMRLPRHLMAEQISNAGGRLSYGTTAAMDATVSAKEPGKIQALFAA